MKYIIILFLLAFATNCSTTKKRTSTPKELLNEVFDIVEKHSINKDSVDLQKIKTEAFSQLKDVKSYEDIYPIIKKALRDLKDNHSFLMSKEQVDKWESSINEDSSEELITFSGKILNENIGYINMKGLNSGDSISGQKYADSLQKLIKSIDNNHIKGWILDLRENTGGNCWPMLAGIGPLLQNGICGYFTNRTEEKSSWFYQDGASGINDFTITKISNEPYKLIDSLNPIAVLTGYKTGSSGEVVVTAFHNKNNTKSFGENTIGLSTGNANFPLSDGSILVLTTTIYADRKGIVFGGVIKPDKTIYFSYQSIGTPNDPVLKKAKNWIIGEE